MTCMDCVSFNVCYKHHFYGRPATLVCCEFKNKADFAEVVRCKDCKHRRESAHRSYCLPVFGLKQITDLNAFCSYGERRDT